MKREPVIDESPTPEHVEWHGRMWDRGARTFFTGSDHVKHAFRGGETIGRFDLRTNKEVENQCEVKAADAVRLAVALSKLGK